MRRVLLVGLGGAVGSVLRFWLGAAVQGGRGGFPRGTLAVNVLGCLAIGALAQLSESRNLLTPELRALLMIGLLGGFTTFSAFANETVDALRGGSTALALLNVALSVVLCLGAVLLGRGVAAAVWPQLN